MILLLFCTTVVSEIPVAVGKQGSPSSEKQNNEHGSQSHRDGGQSSKQGGQSRDDHQSSQQVSQSSQQNGSQSTDAEISYDKNKSMDDEE